MIYRILGQLAIGPPGAELSLPGSHGLIVLAVLLINPNRRVSTEDLLQAAWGNVNVDDTQLHKRVSHLRNLLAPLGRRHDLVTHRGYGYELRVAEEDLDSLVFERLVRDAETARAQRRDEVELLHAALRLWRGRHPLAGVPADPFRREAAMLEQRRKRAAVRLFDLELARGNHQRILGELHKMVGYHPTDGRLCGQLMRALYHSKHGTEALAAYDRHAVALNKQTGGKPDAQLRDLRYAIASGNALAVARYEEVAHAGAGPAAGPAAVPRQLPAALADLVGRDDLIAEACWLLNREPGTATPVVVVTGPGGIGKTALTVQVAHLLREQYPDGQLYVELHGTTAHPLPTGEVLAQFLRAFGVTKVPEARQERAALYRSLVGDRRVLVVLDDAHDETQIRDLIPGNPGCGVLITARQRLPDIDGAHHLPTLEALDLSTAIDLLQRLVRRAGVNLTGEPEATAEVARLCAGLPLALSIAGALRARDHGLTTAGLAERLRHQRPGAFVYGDRSVERSIGAGLDRLDEQARQLFLGLGLLELPDFGLWTAAAVLDGIAADPAETLLRLASRYMVQPTGPDLRYRFHDLTREYARRRAEQHYTTVDDRQVIRRRVYGALLTLARRAHWKIYGGDFEVVHSGTAAWPAPARVVAELERDPLLWYETERWNIRAAVQHTADLGLAELCWDLAVSTHEFYNIRGYLDDWHATHLIALDACRSAGDLRGEAAVTAILGQPTLTACRRPGIPGLTELTRAVGLFERFEDRHGQAVALRTLANALRRRGQLAAALVTFDQALTLYRDSGDEVGRWQSLRYIGQTHLDLGRPDEALRVLRAAERAAREAGQPRLLAQTAYWVGHAQLALGDLTAARESFQVVLDAVGGTDRTGRAYAMHGLGEVARLNGDLAAAERHLQTAADLADQATDVVLESRVHWSLARLRRTQGRAADEVTALARAASGFDSLNATYLQAQALRELSDAYARQGATSAARTARTQAQALWTGMGLPEAGW